MIAWLTDRVWPRFRRTLQNWSDDDGGVLAAAMAYCALFSFFPLLLILISAVGFVLHFSSGAQNAQQQFLDLLAENLSDTVARNVDVVLSEVRAKAAIGGPLGVVALVLAAIGVFAQLEQAFDRIWKVKGPPSKGVLAAVLNAMVHRLRAFLMLLGVELVVVVALVGGIAISAARSLAGGLPGGNLLWGLLEILLSLAVNWLLFTVVYRVIPRARVLWSEAARGAAVAAVLWEINRQFLATYVIGEQYSAYGVVGSIIAVLLWIYIASNIIFLGAEYIRVVQSEGPAAPHSPRTIRRRARNPPDTSAPDRSRRSPPPS
jgi:membrane protein